MVGLCNHSHFGIVGVAFIVYASASVHGVHMTMRVGRCVCVCVRMHGVLRMPIYLCVSVYCTMLCMTKVC